MFVVPALSLVRLMTDSLLDAVPSSKVTPVADIVVDSVALSALTTVAVWYVLFVPSVTSMLSFVTVVLLLSSALRSLTRSAE
jgi:hypothetical protein